MNAGESAFWQFSLRFYQRPEVPAVCLTLQDQHGVDVNLLFFILFLSLNGRHLKTDEVRRIDACVRAWRLRVVQPLRALRRDLKSGIAPVETEAAQALRGAIKRDELLAERLQQEALEREFPVASTGSPAEPRAAAAKANVAAYTSVIGALPEVLVNTLLEALADEF